MARGGRPGKGAGSTQRKKAAGRVAPRTAASGAGSRSALNSLPHLENVAGDSDKGCEITYKPPGPQRPERVAVTPMSGSPRYASSPAFYGGISESGLPVSVEESQKMGAELAYRLEGEPTLQLAEERLANTGARIREMEREIVNAQTRSGGGDQEQNPERVSQLEAEARRERRRRRRQIAVLSARRQGALKRSLEEACGPGVLGGESPTWAPGSEPEVIGQVEGAGGPLELLPATWIEDANTVGPLRAEYCEHYEKTSHYAPLQSFRDEAYENARDRHLEQEPAPSGKRLWLIGPRRRPSRDEQEREAHKAGVADASEIDSDAVRLRDPQAVAENHAAHVSSGGHESDVTGDPRYWVGGLQRVAVHEYCHRVQGSNPEFEDLEFEFIEGQEDEGHQPPETYMHHVYLRSSYDGSEYNTTEVTPVGSETLLFGPRDVSGRDIHEDPGTYHFTLGLWAAAAQRYASREDG